MTTATASAPELIEHEYNDDGVFESPEIVTIAMPKAAACEILIAHKRDTGWFLGYSFKSKTDHQSSPCKVDVTGVETRREAIRLGLVAASKYFAKDKKAIKALEEFHATLGDATIMEKVVMGFGEYADPAEESAEPLPKGKFAEVPVSAVQPNPENHRKFHDAMKAKELADSIKQAGLLQPIAVRLLGADELGEMPMGGEGVEAKRYEIILGERRWRAHVTLGLPVVEAKVYEGVSRADAKAAALIENLQREDVNAIEEAEGYADLMKAKSYTQEQVAQKVGRSRPVVANALRVLANPGGVVDLIRENKLTMAHGMALHKYADRPAIVTIMAEQAVLHSTSAGQLEEWNKANYVPFFRELAKAGIIAVIHRSDLPGGWSSEWPEAWTNDADYQDVDGYSWICWAPAKAREFMDAWKAELAETKQRAVEKAAKDRKKSGIKSLEDLDSDNYEIVSEQQAEITDLLPESKVLTLKSSDEKDAGMVTVCTAPKFTEAVSEAMREAKLVDRFAKLPVLLGEARAKLKKWKKLGPAESAVLLFVSLGGCDDEHAYLSPASAKSQGVTLPALLELEDYEGCNRLPEDQGKALKALAADPVAYARVLVDDFLVGKFCVSYKWTRLEEPTEWAFRSVSAEARALLTAILDKPLGLLEDTAAGRRKLAATVKALPWYAVAYEQASKAGEDMIDIDETVQAGAEGGEGAGDE